MKDEEAISKAASSVEVIGEKLKHPHVVQATSMATHEEEAAKTQLVSIKEGQRV